MRKPLALVTLCLLNACTLPRRDADPALFGGANPAGFDSDIRYYSADWHALDSRVAKKLARIRQASPDGLVNVLALSGGGAAGAFGAGALVGLTRRGERPQFQVVTGVSTGALIAPFAFLGPEWDAQLTEAFSGDRAQSLLHPHWVRGLLRPGAYDARALAELVDRYVTADLIRAVAREASRGRLLEVATTDLDKEETVIWDLGAIAARDDEPARQLFRDVLLASASVPGAFPPVVLHVEEAGTTYDEMHVDGATTVPFIGAPESLFFSSLPMADLKGGKIFVLVNGQLASTPGTTQFRTIPILSKSFAAATRHMTRMQLASTAEFARNHAMDLKFTAVPMDYPRVSPLDFRRSTMRQLFDYGAACATQGQLWTTIDQAISRADDAIAEWQRERSADRIPLTANCPLTSSTVAVEPRLAGG
jgi:predicted acylesterase/phospholipase RssA